LDESRLVDVELDVGTMLDATEVAVRSSSVAQSSLATRGLPAAAWAELSDDA
jgi:hypothetical protein